jgi:hypothetical protein
LGVQEREAGAAAEDVGGVDGVFGADGVADFSFEDW